MNKKASILILFSLLFGCSQTNANVSQSSNEDLKGEDTSSLLSFLNSSDDFDAITSADIVLSSGLSASSNESSLFSDYKSSESVEVNDNPTITFAESESVNTSFVCDTLSLSYDVSNSKNVQVSGNSLILGKEGESGQLVINLGKVISSIVLYCSDYSDDTIVNIGYYNNGGLSIIYDSTKNGNSFSLTFNQYNNPSRIIIKTSARIIIEKIEVVLK